MNPQYWLMKSEPSVYSIDDLKKDKKTLWSGVRNYQARNYMMNEMKEGDLAFFYHSNAEPSGIAGLMKITKVALVDKTALDKKSEYHDPKSTIEKPIWFCTEVQFVSKYNKILALTDLKTHSELKDMPLLQKGSRLSVQKVSPSEFKFIENLIK